MKASRMCWVALVLAMTIQSAWAFYNPQTGRWLNRDPIGESGGFHLYSFVNNDPATHADANGLEIAKIGPEVTCDGPALEGCKRTCIRRKGESSVPILCKMRRITISIPPIPPFTTPGEISFNMLTKCSCSESCKNNRDTCTLLHEGRHSCIYQCAKNVVAEPRGEKPCPKTITRYQP